LEVVMGEGHKPLPISKMSKQARKKSFRAGQELNKRIVDKYEQGSKDLLQSVRMGRAGGKDVMSHVGKGFEQGKKYATRREEYDLYDIILSHLLDEGYAETQEAAEVIMVNMSEDWRESICEELTGERRKRALEKGGYLADRVATGKEGQPVERLVRGGVSGKGPKVSMKTTTKAPTKRGGEEEKGKRKADWSGYAADRGSGNRARRRAGKKVIDTWDGY
jgi:hypothetical protein